MSSKWWTHSWNPVIGCTPASPGCDHCYAKALHDQRHAAFVAGSRIPACYAKPFEQVTCLEERLARPLGWKNPRCVFVNSMSDLFHPDVPFEFLDRVFAVMALASQHTFMICTKRPERMREYLRTYDRLPAALTWPYPNIWLGVTAESQEQADSRIPILLDTPAAKRFVSVEPMLGPVDLSPEGSPGYWYNSLSDGSPVWRGPDWVICGGESGPGARPMHPDWARGLRDQCAAAGVPFFFKQWGEFCPTAEDRMCSVGSRRAGRLLDGVEHNAMPEVQS